MARQIARAGENHRPWHIRHAAPQLAIDEIGQPPEQHSHRHTYRYVIDYPNEIEFVAPCDVSHRYRHPGQPAVERHPAIPQPQQFPADEPVARKIGKGAGDSGLPPGVERRVAKPAANDHAQGAVEKQIIGMALCHWSTGLFEHLRSVPIGENHPDQVCERVEPQGKEPQFDPRFQPQISPVDRFSSDACGK